MLYIKLKGMKYITQCKQEVCRYPHPDIGILVKILNIEIIQLNIFFIDLAC